MEVSQAIRSRRSIRGFKPDPVPRKVFEGLLETCRWAPSARNTQEWDLLILGGKVIAEIKARIVEKYKAKVEANEDVPISALDDMPELYRQRAIEGRDIIDSHQFPPGTEKLDEKRAAYFVKGWRFHDAPNAIILCTERVLYPTAIFDVGIMAQTICLAALDYGLGTTIMARPVYWPDIYREVLGIPESKLIVVSIGIGYPDPEVVVNSFPRHRVPWDVFTQWHGV
ncbi:nitroreductase [Chloroflexota bacterium]